MNYLINTKFKIAVYKLFNITYNSKIKINKLY